MANALNGNPIVLDTAGATSEVTHPLAITAIKYDAPGALGAVCSLHDANGGALLFEHTAAAQHSGALMVFAPPLHAKGLYLTTLASGKLLVYQA